MATSSLPRKADSRTCEGNAEAVRSEAGIRAVPGDESERQSRGCNAGARQDGRSHYFDGYTEGQVRSASRIHSESKRETCRADDDLSPARRPMGAGRVHRIPRLQQGDRSISLPTRLTEGRDYRDQINPIVGLEKGDLTDEEIAAKVAREFFEAVIAADYRKAGLLYEGIPAEKMKETFGHCRLHWRPSRSASQCRDRSPR